MPIGTKVRLSSGGPVMIVVDNYHLGRTGRVTCAYKEGNTVLEYEFNVVCLDVVRKDWLK